MKSSEPPFGAFFICILPETEIYNKKTENRNKLLKICYL